MHRVHHGNVPPPPPHPSLAAAAAVRTHLPFAKCPDSVYLIMSTKDGMVIFDCPGRDPYGMKFVRKLTLTNLFTKKSTPQLHIFDSFKPPIKNSDYVTNDDCMLLISYVKNLES